MNELAISYPTETAPKIKDSVQLAVEAINAHRPACPTCRDLSNIADRVVCPTGNQLWAVLDQAIALDQANQN